MIERLPVAQLAPGMRISFQTVSKPGVPCMYRGCLVTEVDQVRLLLTFQMDGGVEVTVRTADVIGATLYWDKP